MKKIYTTEEAVFGLLFAAIFALVLCLNLWPLMTGEVTYTEFMGWHQHQNVYIIEKPK